MKIIAVGKLTALMEWVQQRLTKRQFILLSSVLVGLSSATAAILLKAFARTIFRTVTTTTFMEGQYLFMVLPIIGILLTVLVAKYVLKDKLDKGLSHIHFAIAQRASTVPREQMYAQILTSSLTVGMGGSAGLEAPIVITGAAFGSNYALTYHLPHKDRSLLLACGIAAGIAAAFNAPIAGVLFAVEVLLLDVSISAFTPLIIAAASGALLSNIFLPGEELVSLALTEAFDYRNVPHYVVLGLLSGLVSVYHSRMFVRVEKLFSKSKRRVYHNVLIGGVMLAGLIWLFPSLFGEGYAGIHTLSSLQPERLMDNSLLAGYQHNAWIVLAFVGAVALAKVFAIAITIGSGGNGGNFAPSLFVGAHLGFFFSRLLNMLDIAKLPESNFTLVGMAGILSGLYHAPLTAIFLIAEITGGYHFMIPLMIVSSISYAISKSFEPFSMDTKRLANSGQIFTDDKDKNILTTIQTTSLIETDFQQLSPQDTLGQLVAVISRSKKNLFPVTDNVGRLLGVVLVDDIRGFLFNTALHDKTFVRTLMTLPPATVSPTEPMEAVMKKFDSTDAWILPVVENGRYLGFISKSSIFSSYREKLTTLTIE